MTRKVSTYFGEPLSALSKKLVNEVRLKITQPIHPRFDNDFNIYRFVLASERTNKKEKEIVDAAAKVLNEHLRIRKALLLDDLPDIPFDQNPLFSKRFLPKGELLDETDSCNRLLWYVEYASIDVEILAQILRSSESIRLQFHQFEHMLRRVNLQEEKTGKLSGLRHIVDLNGYEINPFTMIFVSNGNLAYYSQLLHFENYPELVSPLEMVNVPKWIHLPYTLAKSMMPDGFTERFRLHDANFLPVLSKEINIADIPESLGGKNKVIKCQPALKLIPEEYRMVIDSDLIQSLETFYVSPRRRRQFYVDVHEGRAKLQWYYVTDGDIYFGAFLQPFEQVTSPARKTSITNAIRQEKEVNCDEFEMVYPWLRLAAKLVHEMDTIECRKPGRYWFIFCNKFSWFHKKTVNIAIELIDELSNSVKRCHTDGTYSKCSKPFEVSRIY